MASVHLPLQGEEGSYFVVISPARQLLACSRFRRSSYEKEAEFQHVYFVVINLQEDVHDETQKMFLLPHKASPRVSSSSYIDKQIYTLALLGYGYNVTPR